jgi:hypothetical protein
MASYTPNYNLVKIDLSDAPPDITVLNSNFDTIDEELAGAGGFVMMNSSLPTTQRTSSKLYALKVRDFS